MPTSWLLDKNFNGGVQNSHYFDGRLLSADALYTDQQCVQSHQGWLGTAAGHGVISGLVVSKVSTGGSKISITAGLSLTYAGHTVRLVGDTQLDLSTTQAVPEQTAATRVTERTSRRATFARVSSSNVQPQPSSTSVGSATKLPEGVYLFTALPVTQFAGLAPMKSTVNGVSTGISNAPGCGSKWKVEGVQFKVIRLASSDLHELFTDADDIILDSKGNRRQNLLAHWCYGTLVVRNFGIHPFTATDQYAPLDPLSSTIPDLSKDDLPLAVFHWDGNQITFVDPWSARRRIIHPDALAGTANSLRVGTWKALLDDRRCADNQARFRQFQDQLDTIVSQGNCPSKGVDLSKIKATDYFMFLPPVGFLPVTQESLQALICAQGDTPRQKSGEKETTKWDVGLHLTLSEADLHMLGLFAVDAATVLGVQVPGIQYLRPLIGSAGNLIAQLFHSHGSAVAEMMQRPETSTSQTGIEPNQPITLGVELSGSSMHEKTGPEAAYERFRERVCVTLSQSRKQADGTPRSSTEGFDLSTFFQGYLLRICLIGKDRVDLLVNQSWYEDAIDLRPDRHPDPKVANTGDSAYPVRRGLYPMPLLFDIYLVEENLLDLSQPLYILFHKSLHPIELLKYDRQ